MNSVIENWGSGNSVIDGWDTDLTPEDKRKAAIRANEARLRDKKAGQEAALEESVDKMDEALPPTARLGLRAWRAARNAPARLAGGIAGLGNAAAKAASGGQTYIPEEKLRQAEARASIPQGSSTTEAVANVLADLPVGGTRTAVGKAFPKVADRAARKAGQTITDASRVGADAMGYAAIHSDEDTLGGRATDAAQAGVAGALTGGLMSAIPRGTARISDEVAGIKKQVEDKLGREIDIPLPKKVVGEGSDLSSRITGRLMKARTKGKRSKGVYQREQMLQDDFFDTDLMHVFETSPEGLKAARKAFDNTRDMDEALKAGRAAARVKAKGEVDKRISEVKQEYATKEATRQEKAGRSLVSNSEDMVKKQGVRMRELEALHDAKIARAEGSPAKLKKAKLAKAKAVKELGEQQKLARSSFGKTNKIEGDAAKAALKADKESALQGTRMAFADPTRVGREKQLEEMISSVSLKPGYGRYNPGAVQEGFIPRGFMATPATSRLNPKKPGWNMGDAAALGVLGIASTGNLPPWMEGIMAIGAGGKLGNKARLQRRLKVEDVPWTPSRADLPQLRDATLQKILEGNTKLQRKIQELIEQRGLAAAEEYMRRIVARTASEGVMADG